MTEQRIVASSVTKPIQLLAAWLVGLLALNASFLGAAAIISEPPWAAGFLVICAALNVPVFLGCLFLLQTKFRPEMQEDSYYAKYLEGRVSTETGQVEIFQKPTPLEIIRGATTRSQSYSSTTQSLAQINSEIRLNDLLPAFAEIVKRLNAAGIKTEETFGSSSEDPEVPPFNLVSIQPVVPVAEAQAVLRLLDGLIDKVGLAQGPAPDKKNIYIGSYGYQFGHTIYDYDDALKAQLLSPGLTQEALLRLLDRGVES